MHFSIKKNLAIRKLLSQAYVRLSYFFINKFKKNLITNSTLVAGRKLIKDFAFFFFFSPRNFQSVSIRPKYNLKNLKPIPQDCEDVSLIIQGPICKKDDFTLNSVKLYNHLFPTAKVILSTWQNEEESYIELFRKLDCHIVKNKYPETSGWKNINYQLQTTNSGVQLAKKLGSSYVAKTRTDFRLYSPSSISFLKSLLKTFPSSDFSSNRIIISDIATCRHRIYGATDIFHFGKVETIDQYWDPLNWEKSIENYFDGKKLINGTPLRSEIFLCARYLKQKYGKIPFSLEHWWSCLKNDFIVVDFDDIDAFWYKYDYHLEQRFSRSYLDHPRNVRFADWLSLYNGFINDFHSLNKDGSRKCETWAYNQKVNKYIRVKI